MRIESLSLLLGIFETVVVLSVIFDEFVPCVLVLENSVRWCDCVGWFVLALRCVLLTLRVVVCHLLQPPIWFSSTLRAFSVVPGYLWGIHTQALERTVSI